MGYLALSSMTKMMGGMMQMPSGASGSFSMFRYFGVWIALKVLLGVFVIAAAIQFLRLRAWARSTLEVVSWLGLVYVLATGIMSVVAWGKMSGTVTLPASDNFPSAFGAMGLLFSVVTMVLFAVPLIVVIWYLRGETIKEAMRLR